MNIGIRSLKFKMPAIIISMVVIAIVILLIGVIKIAEDNIIRTSLDGFERTSGGYAALFDTWLSEQVTTVKTYGSLSSIRDYMKERTRDNLTAVEKELRDQTRYNEYVINVGIADTNGIVLIDSHNPNLEGVSIPKEHPEAWIALKNSGYDYYYVDELTKSLTTGNLSLTLLAGIKDSQNNLVGIIYEVLDWSTLIKKHVENANIGKTGRIFAVDKNLNIVINNNMNLINTKAPEEFKEAWKLKKGTIEYTLNGVKILAVFQTMKTQEWILGVAMDESEIFSANRVLIIAGITIGIIAIIVIAIVIIIFARTITTPLGKIVKQANTISEGDLITNDIGNIERGDELGDLSKAFEVMRKELISTITIVKESINQITYASEELAQGNADLAHRTESQAASLEETASSMEEMASTIKSSTGHSIEGNKMMNESKVAIENAGGIITTTTKNIEEVFEASAKIVDITKMIENIAFQTNILALNAAVEAARAGEQGRGFAVVASEVRNLAQTTQTSVKDITELIEDANDKIKRATESARESKEIFDEIQQKIEKTSTIMQDISATAVEQQSGVDQVNKAVTEMDMATQQNAALVEEATAASESLFSQARELADAMRFFKLQDNNGKKDEKKGTDTSKKITYNPKSEISKKNTHLNENRQIKNNPRVTNKIHHSEFKMNSKKSDEFGKTFENENDGSEGFESF